MGLYRPRHYGLLPRVAWIDPAGNLDALDLARPSGEQPRPDGGMSNPLSMSLPSASSIAGPFV